MCLIEGLGIKLHQKCSGVREIPLLSDTLCNMAGFLRNSASADHWAGRTHRLGWEGDLVEVRCFRGCHPDLPTNHRERIDRTESKEGGDPSDKDIRSPPVLDHIPLYSPLYGGV